MRSWRDAAVDGPEGGQQAAPGVVPALEDLLAVLVGSLAELLAQGRDGVVLVVERVAEQEQVALLGAEQEDKPHHDGECGLVDLGLGHPGQELAAVVLVGAVEGADQHLDCPAHLVAELVGDLLLVLGALAEQRLGRVRGRDAEEPPRAEEAAERAQGEGLLEPQLGVPRGEAGRLAARGIDQHPVLAVGYEPEPHAGGVEQLRHPRGRRRLPALAEGRPLQVLFRRVGDHEHARLAVGRVTHHGVGRSVSPYSGTVAFIVSGMA